MRVSVGDLSLFVEISGQGLPVVIGLHGGPGLDGSKLRYQLSPLADAAQIVVPDQRGHGRSDHGSAETWNLASWAADVKSLSDALEVEHPVVLGVSFGGFVAQQYAATYPEQAAALILISTATRFAGPDETATRFQEVGGEAAAEVFWRSWEKPSEENAEEWRRVIGPLMSVAKQPDPMLAKLRAARVATMDVNVHFMAEGKAMDLRERLATVRCPTLVVNGEQDPLVPPHLGREIVEAIPEHLARLEVIPDASHDVFADNPTRSYGVIREFLASSSTVSA